MDMYSIGVAMGATQMANMPGVGTQDGTVADGVNFAQVLNSMIGGQTQTGDATQEQLFAGLTWRDIQSGMMMNAMQTLQDAEQPMPTDPVLAQLMEALKNLSAGSGSEADVLQLIEQMQKRLKEIVEEDGAEAAGQQALVLMNAMMGSMTGMPMPDAAMNAFSADGGAALTQMMLQNTPQDIVGMLYGRQSPTAYDGQNGQAAAEFASLVEGAVAEGQAQSPMAVVQQQAVAVQAPQVQEAQAGQATQAQVVQQAAAVPVAEAAAQVAASTGVQVSAQPVQMEAAETTGVTNANVVAVEEEVMAGQAAGTSAAADDRPVEAAAKPQKAMTIDQLQQHVDSGTFLQNTALAGTQGKVGTQQVELPQPLADQMQTGISTGITSGAEQFTVTLKPVELGEVTIKLKRTDEGLKLDIIARNPETQRLLAQELNMLKEALRPMNVEVDSVMTEQQADLLAGQQEFGSRAQQQWREVQDEQQNGRTGSAGVAGVATDGEAQESAAPQPGGQGLDTYI